MLRFLCALSIGLHASSLLAQPGEGPSRVDGGALIAGPVPLIPREVFFGNPDRAMVRVSPDGKWISFLAADQGVLNVFVAPVDEPANARPVTRDRARGIQEYVWSFTPDLLLYLQDVGGDENWRLHSVNVANSKDTPLVAQDGVQARIMGIEPSRPRHVLVGINDRDPQFHDVHAVDIANGQRELVQACPPGIVGWVFDRNWKNRLGMSLLPDGGASFVREVDGQWKSILDIASDDLLTTGPIGFAADARTLIMRDSRGRDTSALYSLDTTTLERKLLSENPHADLDEILLHPRTHEVQAVAYNRLRSEWVVLDPVLAPEFEALDALGDGELRILSRTLDDKTWVVAHLDDDGPVRYYLHRPGSGKPPVFLFNNRDALASLRLSPMFADVIPSRDGLQLVSYLTLPVWTVQAGSARPASPLPLVLLVHGGPWARDTWGYNPLHQLLANRGYAVLSVNFRGSTGFGKSFTNAANREWGARMHDDLIDAVDWAIANAIADPDRVAIMGGSYGGYATLIGLTFTPDKFAAGVDIVGPSNLVTLLETIPPYWKPLLSLWQARVGDPTTPEGRAFLDSRSPLNHVDAIRKPLLIGQGANDPRVKQSESDQIVAAMQQKGIPVTYVVFPDEGHGFARPENNMAFFGLTENFLAEHLGGRAEPLSDALERSSAQVRAGNVPK